VAESTETGDPSGFFSGSHGLRIDPAAPADCREIAEVHVLSWQHAYRGLIADATLDALSVDQREALWREALDRQQPQLLVARNDAGALTGFIAFGRSRDADASADGAEVWALYVAPAAWSRGVGRSLWDAARERLRCAGFGSVSLWVIEGNARAIAFYEAMGWRREAGSAKRFELNGQALDEVRYRFVQPAD
jgi:ribosomal protein S18 acetylase RimI-like enzyme